MKWGSKTHTKVFQIKVCTYDNDLNFHISVRTTGQTLFDMVCASIGLQETEYFGLENYYIDSSGQMQFTKWLKMEKRISAQKLNHSPLKQLKFLLHPKFFPEDIEQELIQPITRHIFYLDVRNTLLKQSVSTVDNFVTQNQYSFSKDNCSGDKFSEEGQLDIDDGSSSRSYPSSDVVILLTSLSAQAECGDLSETEIQDDEERMFLSVRLSKLLPSSLLMQCQLSQDVTHRIKQCYKSHKGMSREDAELSYLRVASYYRLFGTSYFMITDKMNCASWLGISANGIHLYQLENKRHPLNSFSWQIIKNVTYKERKFSIKLSTNDVNLLCYPHSPTSTARVTIPSDHDFSLMSTASLSTHLSIPGLPACLLKEQANNSLIPNLSIDTTKTVSLATSSKNCTVTTSLGLNTINRDSCRPCSDVVKIDVWLQTPKQTKILMRLCKGNSELFIKRRQPESSQTKQMRIKAIAERTRRETEQSQLNKARVEKQIALEAKEVLEDKVAELEAALESCKTAGQLIAEKARYAQQEAKLHEDQVHELTRCLDRGLIPLDNCRYFESNGNGHSSVNFPHPGNSLPSLRCHSREHQLTIPDTDPLARRRLSPLVSVKQLLMTAESLSVQQIETELRKERARFDVLQNHFLSELCEAYSHLEKANGTINCNRNKLHSLFNDHWQPGLDAWDVKKEFGPNYRDQMVSECCVGWSDRGRYYPSEMVGTTGGYVARAMENHYSVPMTSGQSVGGPSRAGDVVMMPRMVMGMPAQYYKTGGYIVNNTR